MLYKIGFYLDNSEINSVDVSTIRDGNPGMGGTQYITFLLANELSRVSGVDVTLYLRVHQFGIEKTIISFSLASDLKSVFSNNDFTVVNQGEFTNQAFCSWLKTTEHKVIVWSHNYLTRKLSNLLSECNNVVQNVFVSKQMFDLHYHHKIIRKSSWIFHGVVLDKFQFNSSINELKHVVTYIGAITRGKSFHVLAKQWGNVLRAFPDARLNVIGSGKLYNQCSSLGPYGIADAVYEKEILNYLLDESGSIIPSVVFHGVLNSNSLRDVLSETYIGVVNPRGSSETFCLSALDFLSSKIPVVTINDYSLPDLINHNRTGMLYNNYKDLSKYIIELMANPLKRDYLANNISKEIIKFDIEFIVSNWIVLFDKLSSTSSLNLDKISPPMTLRKRFVVVYSILQRITGYKLPLPPDIGLRSLIGNLRYIINNKF